MKKSRKDTQLLLLIFAIALVLSSADRACAGSNESTKPTLYFFTNEGCRPCKQIEPMLRSLAEQGYPITKVDTSQYPLWVQEFQIASTPTVVMVKGNAEVTRKSGFVDQGTIVGWFERSGFTLASSTNSDQEVVVDKQDRESFIKSVNKKRRDDRLLGDTSTIHQGTRQPSNEMEQRAMQATVRLRVEDPEGISFATGTVVHCHRGEWLVMTCGHVFRDAQGKGVITAEYDFTGDTPRKAPGRLLSYNASAKDIGLVSVQAGHDIEPFPIAPKQSSVNRGDTVFSIGCDHGQAPTIRRTKIKNKAAYDKVIKYDIYGRPVDGRSGGGLFSADGTLIGVCNAASVDFDEGIYTGLDTIYWQIAKVNLNHLFQGNRPALSLVADNSRLGSRNLAGDRRLGGGLGSVPEREAAGSTSSNNGGFQNRSQLAGQAGAVLPVDQGQDSPPWNRDRSKLSDRFADSRPFTKVDWNRTVSEADSNMEVIMIVRSKSDPTRAETITLTDPSPKLLRYLEKLGQQQAGHARIDMAQLRQISR